MAGQPETLVRRVVAFGRELRAAGVKVHTTAAMAAAEAVSVVDVTDSEQFYFALQATLTADPQEQQIFAAIFARFWGIDVPEGCGGDSEPGGSGPGPPQAGAPEPEAGDDLPGEGLPGAVPAAPAGATAASANEAERDSPPADEDPAAQPDLSAGGQRSGAALTEVTAARYLTAVGAVEAARLRRVVRRLLTPLQYLPAAAAARRHSTGPLDMRRTLRRNLRYGGEVLDLVRRRKTPSRIDLVALLDISGSMDSHTEFLLQFLYALQASSRNVETFAFSTRLTRITPYLRRGFTTARNEVAARVRHWSGGTRVGESLKQLLDRWGDGCSGASTCGLIISDGWDRGDPELLAQQLERLRRRTRTVIWLNPLLGMEGYVPLARGLRIASRYVDVFLPTRDAQSLLTAASLMFR